MAKAKTVLKKIEVPFTKAEANKVLRWFQRNIGLLGWKVTFIFGPLSSSDEQRGPPFGCCVNDLTYHEAKIYINLKEHEGRDGDVVDTIMHELIHASNCECGIIDDGEAAEYGVRMYAAILTKQYRADNA